MSNINNKNILGDNIITKVKKNNINILGENVNTNNEELILGEDPCKDNTSGEICPGERICVCETFCRLLLTPCDCDTAPCPCVVAPCSCDTQPCSCDSRPCSCDSYPCYCDTEPCSCNSEPCSCNSDPCSCNTAPCSCNTAPCSCNSFPCPLDGAPFGYEYFYFAFTPKGKASGHTSTYIINWLSTQSGDWKNIKLTCKDVTSSTYAITMSSTTINGNIVYYAHGFSQATYYPSESETKTVSATIEIPGHEILQTNITAYAVTGSTLNNAINRLNNKIKNGSITYASNIIATTRSITLQQSNTTLTASDNTKYGSVKYKFSNNNTSSEVMVYSLYTSSNNGYVFPTITIHCPYPTFNIERSRPGFTYDNGNVVTYSLPYNVTERNLYFELFPTTNVVANTNRVAKLKDLKILYPNMNVNSVITKTNDNVCLSSKISIPTEPFGCQVIRKTTNNSNGEVILLKNILGISGLTNGSILYDSNWNNNTPNTAKVNVYLL